MSFGQLGVVALVGYLALLNSVAWLLTDVPDAEPSEGDGGE